MAIAKLFCVKRKRNKYLLKEIRIPKTVNVPVPMYIFHPSVIVYCQQNRYVRLILYTVLFNLMIVTLPVYYL